MDKPLSTARPASAPLEKALIVLELIVSSESPLTPAEVARRLGMPRQTAHRLLLHLQGSRFLRRGAGGRLEPGERLVRLGIGGLSHAWRGGPVHRLLRELVDDVGETCNLGVMERDAIVYVDRVECDWPLRVQLGPGSRVPLHATGIGKLLLAHLPARARRRFLATGPFPRYTPNTITEPETLERELTRIRARGYSANDQESVLGLVGLAVPVRAAGGRVVAGVSLHAPSARTPLERAMGFLDRFHEAARRLEEQMALESGAD